MPTNNGQYEPLNEDQMKTLFTITIAELENKDKFEESIKEFIEKDFICRVVNKRVEVFKLPRFEPSAIIMISILSRGNPGRAVLAMVEILEKHQELKPESINNNFISSFVYPWGFYTQDAFEKEFDFRRGNRDSGFNFLF